MSTLSLSTLVAAAAPPAGGAALGQVILATAAALVLTSGLLVLGLGHRSGRVALLGRIAGFSERKSGLPGWAALPSLIATVALLVALVGFLWDVSIHIDSGRDEGPLANPSHYLILGGLFGVFTAGFVACVLPLAKPSASSVRIVGDWYAPLGGVIVLACGMFALIGFPLDDVWHRLFGQDVTLWGPTHLMLIGGAAMTLVGLAILLVEAGRARPGAEQGPTWLHRLRRIALSGGLLMGLMVFPVEFDFGVPQFRMVFGPILVMLAAGIGLVATRMWLGWGAALGAVGFFLVVRALVSLFVGPVMGETTPHFALFIVEALAVEAVFLALPRARPLTLGLASGAAIGTFGLAAEWGWSNLWMPIPWTADLFPEGAILGFGAAVAGALVGAWMGERLASDELPRLRATRLGAVAGALAIFAIVGFALVKPSVEDTTARVSLDEVSPGQVIPTVQMNPVSAADGAEFLNVTAWQGGGLVLEPLEPTDRPGEFTTEEPIPVTGDWKSLIRMSNGNTLSAIPIYLPRDEAIPAPGVPAEPSFEREFVADHTILQREQKDAASWLSAAAYLAVAAIAMALLVLIAWALHRLALSVETPAAQPVATREPKGAARIGPRLPA